MSEKQQLALESNVGHGTAKIQQGCCTKSLCLDIFRLTIFTKNVIDVNKLDDALAFRIHGKIIKEKNLRSDIHS